MSVCIHYPKPTSKGNSTSGTSETSENSFWHPTEKQKWDVRTQKCRMHLQQIVSNIMQMYNFHSPTHTAHAISPASSFSLSSLSIALTHSFLSARPPSLTFLFSLVLFVVCLLFCRRSLTENLIDIHFHCDSPPPLSFLVDAMER